MRGSPNLSLDEPPIQVKADDDVPAAELLEEPYPMKYAPALPVPPPHPALRKVEADLPPPKPKTEYHGGITFHLRREFAAWLVALSLALLFVFSFFPWQRSELVSLNLWELAFSSSGHAIFVFYLLLYWLALPLGITLILLEKNVIPTPPHLEHLVPWGSLTLFGILVLSWILFLAHYVRCNFAEMHNPATVWMKLAFRLHFWAMLGSLADFWLLRRRKNGLLDPRFRIQW